MKADEWYATATKHTDAFSRFYFLWLSFNNLYASYYHRDERRAIQNLLDNELDEKQSVSIITNSRNQIKTLTDRPVLDMRDGLDRTSIFVHSFNNARSYKSKIKELFMIIYQVRCNLFHGQKSPSRQRDQQLCEASAHFVELLLEELI